MTAEASGSVRLQKVLSQHGYGSRRACDDLIAAGDVSVDGVVAVLGQRVDPARSTIEVRGNALGPTPPSP